MKRPIPPFTVPMALRKRPCLLMFRRYWRFLRRTLPPVFYNQLRLLCKLGYWPDLRRPETLNEKIVHRNLFHVNELHSRVTDKQAVRDYVAEKVGAHVLNELYHRTRRPEDIPFDDLPERFVVKANHGCGWNILVDGSEPVDRARIMDTASRWLRKTYGKLGDETMYYGIEPWILVEKYLVEEGQRAPRDYKFYCFHGEVKLIQYQEDRFQGMQQTFYDADWTPLDLTMRVSMADPIPRPPFLDDMLDVSRKLAADFDFARVDLYCPDGKQIVFGEITLSPGAGGLGLEPRSWDWTLGRMWELPGGPV